MRQQAPLVPHGAGGLCRRGHDAAPHTGEGPGRWAPSWACCRASSRPSPTCRWQRWRAPVSPKAARCSISPSAPCSQALLGMLFVGRQRPGTGPAALWLLPIGLAGAFRPAVHDARLLQRSHHGGGQPAVLGHRVRRLPTASSSSATRLPLMGWLGMALIIVSGITATVLRTRARAERARRRTLKTCTA